MSRTTLLALLIGLIAVPAFAGPREVRGAAAGSFDLYLLALSWSPGFCESGGENRSPEQCRDGAGLGFVVHGLWPQFERGYPAFCSPDGRGASRRDIAIVEGIVPTEGLARHQWRKHGSCSGLVPSAYFRAISDLHARVAVPVFDDGDDVRPLDVERAFAAANPGLRTDMIAVQCGRGEGGRTILREVRLCLTRDLRDFRACPIEVERDDCRAATIDIPPPR